MTTEIALRYLHFISIFTIVGVLVSEHILLKKELTRAEIARLAKIDAVYGIAALALIGAGLTLWFGNVGKPAMFYSKKFSFYFDLLWGLGTSISSAAFYETGKQTAVITTDYREYF